MRCPPGIGMLSVVQSRWRRPLTKLTTRGVGAAAVAGVKCIAAEASADSLRRYRARYGLHAHAAVDAEGAFQRRFAVDAYPTFIVLDKSGEPRGRFRGAGSNVAAIEATYSALLGNDTVPGGTGIE